MAPKPAASASATAKPTASAAPTSSRPSTPNTAAKVNDLALADEEIYKDADTDKLVNGLVDKRKADLETCMWPPQALRSWLQDFVDFGPQWGRNLQGSNLLAEGRPASATPLDISLSEVSLMHIDQLITWLWALNSLLWHGC